MIPPNFTSLLVHGLALVGLYRIVCLANEAVARKLEDREWRRTIGDIRHLPELVEPPEAEYELFDPEEGEYW